MKDLDILISKACKLLKEDEEKVHYGSLSSSDKKLANSLNKRVSKIASRANINDAEYNEKFKDMIYGGGSNASSLEQKYNFLYKKFKSEGKSEEEIEKEINNVLGTNEEDKTARAKKLLDLEKKTNEMRKAGKSEAEIEKLWKDSGEGGFSLKRKLSDAEKNAANLKGNLYSDISEFLYLIKGLEKTPTKQELKESLDKLKKKVQNLVKYEEGFIK